MSNRDCATETYQVQRRSSVNLVNLVDGRRLLPDTTTPHTVHKTYCASTAHSCLFTICSDKQRSHHRSCKLWCGTTGRTVSDVSKKRSVFISRGP